MTNLLIMIFSTFSILQQMENEMKRPRLLFSPVHSMCHQESAESLPTIAASNAAVDGTNAFIENGNSQDKAATSRRKAKQRRTSTLIPVLVRSKAELENLLTSGNIDPNKPVRFIQYFMSRGWEDINPKIPMFLIK
jgi:hypothetical protein